MSSVQKPLYNYEEKCVDGAGNEIHILTTKVPCATAKQVIGIAASGATQCAQENGDALREAEQKYRGLIDKAIVGSFRVRRRAAF